MLSISIGLSHAHADTDIESVYWFKQEIVIEVEPQANEGYIKLATRVLAKPTRYQDLATYNKKRPLKTSKNVAIPLSWLQPKLQGKALRILYPADQLSKKGWVHTVTDRLETLTMLSRYFTGKASKWRAIAKFNGIRHPNRLRQGQRIIIPARWLHSAYAFVPVALKTPLRLKKQKGLYFAAYHIQAGDTPTGIVERFTDRVHATEINRLTQQLLKLNRIASPQQLKAGRWIKMPIAWIDTEYTQQTAARQTQKTIAKKSAAQKSVQQKATTLNASHSPKSKRPKLPNMVAKTISKKHRLVYPPAPSKKQLHVFPPIKVKQPQQFHVIIDAGHGGTDPGAIYALKSGNYLTEHEVVYDIALRFKALLKTKNIIAHMLVEDPHAKTPSKQLNNKRLGKERVRVTPFYRMESAEVAINMRIMAVHHLYQRLTLKHGVKPEHIVLLSIHGDALAKERRGAMVYYVQPQQRSNRFQLQGKVYRSRKEFKALPAAAESHLESPLKHMNGKSLAKQILDSFRTHSLQVSDRQPIRSFYYRDGKPTLPGILRYSPLPYSVLIEVANLNNAKDRALIRRAASRQKVARALLHGVLQHRKQNSANPIQQPSRLIAQQH